MGWVYPGFDRKLLYISVKSEDIYQNIDKGSFGARRDNTITAKAEMIAKYLQVDALPDFRGFKKEVHAL